MRLFAMEVVGRGAHDHANANPVAALSSYCAVLALDSSNVAALSQSGWLDFSAGSASHNAAIVEVGSKNLEKAVALAPRQAAPRLYLTIAADSTPGNRTVAISEFRVFLTLRLLAGQLAMAKPILEKLGLSTKWRDGRLACRRPFEFPPVPSHDFGHLFALLANKLQIQEILACSLLVAC
jgi:hypothetical protein